MTGPELESVARLLRGASAFRQLDDAVLRVLAGTVRERELEPGDELVRQGEGAGSVFILFSGSLDVFLEGLAAPLRELEPGSVVGEIALMAGGRRTATVRARDAARVLELDRPQFEALAEQYPQIATSLSSTLLTRARRSQIASHLEGLFGPLDAAALESIESEVAWVHLATGEELFRQGAPADCAYLVAFGRLRIALSSGSGERVLGEVGPGQWIGEVALLTGTVRSASAFAVRDTELASVSRRSFEKLLERHPRATFETARRLGARLVERTSIDLPSEASVEAPGVDVHRRNDRRTFAVCPVTPDGDVRAFVSDLVGALARFGSALHLTSDRIDELLRKKGIANVPVNDPAHSLLTPWLLEMESAHRFVVYEADQPRSHWAERGRRNADHVLFVADARGYPAQPALQDLATDSSIGRSAKRTLVLLQHLDRQVFPGTSAWLRALPVDEHLHVRKGSREDVARVARVLTGHAVCLVLGGGASRGFAHIGALRACEQLGIPVDAIGGTSMGAAVSAARSLGMNSTEVLRACTQATRGILDPTLPLVSLVAGRRNMENLRRILGDLDIEDTATTFFCVSTNLSRAREVLHRRGRIATAVCASCAVPGIFPPVTSDGDLLVDGGLSNNVPTDTMAALMGGFVVAVDVIPQVDVRAEREIPLHLSGWDVAWRSLNPFGRPVGLPSIARILLRSATTGGEGFRRATRSAKHASLYLQPALSAWNVLDFRSAAVTADEGYTGMIGPLRTWWAEHRAAVLP